MATTDSSSATRISPSFAVAVSVDDVDRLHVASDHLKGLISLMLTQEIFNDGTEISGQVRESVLGLASHLAGEIHDLQCKMLQHAGSAA